MPVSPTTPTRKVLLKLLIAGFTSACTVENIKTKAKIDSKL